MSEIVSKVGRGATKLLVKKTTTTTASLVYFWESFTMWLAIPNISKKRNVNI